MSGEKLDDYMIKSKEIDGLAEALKSLPRGSVVSVIGAGGKTTTIRQLAHHYRKKGLKVLVTTTTHMEMEEPVWESSDAIAETLDREGYAFAASPVIHRGLLKASRLPDDILKKAIAAADTTFIEADGARRLPFKLPKSTEPVIIPETTLIVLVAGMKTVGQPLGEIVYNYEALLKTDETLTEKTPMTPEIMAAAYKVFLKRIHDEWTAVPTVLLAGQADTAERQEDARAFLEAFCGD